MPSIFVTQNGRKLLNQRFNEAVEKLRQIQSQKGEAYDVGGDNWHDNFAFEELNRQEMICNRQIADIRALQDQQVQVASPTDEEHVQIGHVISLEDEDGSVRKFRVAGYGETDLHTQPPTLEYGAPIIFPFIGMEVGTEARVQIRGKQTTIVLTAIKKES